VSRQVIVIGAGLAGMSATLAAHGEGADVILMARGEIGLGTNSAMANGVFAGPSAGYTEEAYVRDTLEIGKGINHEPYVRLVAREGPPAWDFLRSLGLNLVETAPGTCVLQAPEPDVVRGAIIVRTLAETIRGLEKVRVVTGFHVAELVRHHGRVCGVRGWDRAGQLRAMFGSSVILATGGAGAIYLRNDNQRSTLGQGFLLAAKAGLELWDMEFVQFYPFVIAEPHLPSVMLYPPYPREVRLLDASGVDLAAKYGLGDLTAAIRRRRDELSAMIFNEGLAGPVRMDLTRVSAAPWEHYPLKLLSKIKFDFRRQPVAVSPGAHFFMGGVRIHENCETAAAGLFACGEVVWGLHGANRRGGNALTECVVTGRIAGREAARQTSSGEIAATDPDRPHPAWSAFPTPATGELRRLRSTIREVAWRCAGVVRSEEGLARGLKSIPELEGRLGGINPGTIAEMRLKGDLTSALFVLKVVLSASVPRRESRGAFKREDAPREDNVNWRKNSRLAYDPLGGKVAVSHHPTNGSEGGRWSEYESF
jgi:succinate dehydrogenase/fumarate reductase flavoprotein subunit